MQPDEVSTGEGMQRVSLFVQRQTSIDRLGCMLTNGVIGVEQILHDLYPVLLHRQWDTTVNQIDGNERGREGGDTTEPKVERGGTSCSVGGRIIGPKTRDCCHRSP